MSDPVIDIADRTYTRGRKVDIAERRKYGRLEAHTSNTVGSHYLRITMSEPRERTEWAWQEIARTLGADKATETRVGIRLNAKQVKQLMNYLGKWLHCHYHRDDMSAAREVLNAQA